VTEHKEEITDDAIGEWVKNFTSRIGDGAGDPEENYISTLKLVASCNAGKEFLEIGTGAGRIINIVMFDAKHIVGLEPDTEKFRECKNGFRNNDKVDVCNMTVAQYRVAFPDKKFDVITVSMLLQHVSTVACEEILREVCALLAPHGVAVIGTTHFFEERFLYQHSNVPSSQNAFDAYAKNSGDQPNGLPVRMFSKESLRGALERAALEVVAWGQFSYVRPEKVEEFAHMYQIAPESLRDTGMSQYAVVRHESSAADVFSEVYARNIWGGNRGELFSGSGSRGLPAQNYVQAVRRFIGEAHVRSVVDVGCGDFKIGAEIASACEHFTGTDIVPALIEQLQRTHGNDRVRFYCLDVARGEMPDGELCLVRQVFQHLSNSEILAALRRLRKYEHVIFTEFYPAPTDFKRKNVDIVHGSDTRLLAGSGVYLDEPPFALSGLIPFLEVPAHEGSRPTNAYQRGTIKSFLWFPAQVHHDGHEGH
jgi:SAM-dependent methyltransferase